MTQSPLELASDNVVSKNGNNSALGPSVLYVLKWAPILDGPATYANVITLKTACRYNTDAHIQVGQKITELQTL